MREFLDAGEFWSQGGELQVNGEYRRMVEQIYYVGLPTGGCQQCTRAHEGRE